MAHSKPKILLIYTGGTIGMIENPVTKALEPFDFNHLLDNVPKIKMLDFEIDNFQFDVPIDSADMNPSHWGQMAKVIEDNYADYDGFVILHGTDTMAYTASALSFMLNNLTKPVIITGSQLPIGEVRTDGEENLITALQVAAARDTDRGPMVRRLRYYFRILCYEATEVQNFPQTTSMRSDRAIILYLPISDLGSHTTKTLCSVPPEARSSRRNISWTPMWRFLIFFRVFRKAW